MFKPSVIGLRGHGINAAVLLGALGAGMLLNLSADGVEQGHPPNAGTRTIHATVFAKVSDPHTDSPLGPNYQSLIEGGAFGPDGDLYLTDVAAPAGEPKVLKLDMETKEVTGLHTDDDSIYSSAQFSPSDGKLYLTDFLGRVERMDPDGSHVTTVFDGPVDGREMVADDIAFDADGNMYITDFAGTPWEPTGRIVRLNADGQNPVVLQDGLASPNGISFTPDYSRLWVSESLANRMSNFGLSADGTTVPPNNAFIGMYVNEGLQPAREGYVHSALDSSAVDADGNVYQAVHGAGEILVWNQDGDLLATVKLKDPGVTNLVIEPGTRNAFALTGGENGAYVYRFRALGEGIGQSNGGGRVF